MGSAFGRAGSFAAAACAALALSSPDAIAQSPAAASTAAPSSPSAADLDAARALFAEAFRDERAGRFRDALHKFQEVRKVRDTPAVEYRIGSCEEGVGEIPRAYLAYRRATRIGAGDASVADVVEAARARVDALTPNVARLELRFPVPPPADLEVRIDGEVVPVASLVEPLVLEPGRHDVTARFGTGSTVHDDVVLSEGGQVALTVAEAAAPEPRPMATGQPPAVGSSPRRSAAIGALVGAGVLEVAALVLALVRQGEIAKLTHDCPGGRCPASSDRDDLEATRSRALTEGPVAIALGAAGFVAGGVGIYLAVAPSAAAGARTAFVAGVSGSLP
jgi:hypothetical protein